MKPIKFKSLIIRQEISSRGGGIEIDLTTLGYPGEKMTAYQNYLGGGLLGRVCSDCTIKHNPFVEVGLLDEIAEIETQLKQYFHSLTNPDKEEQPWESKSFEQNQKMPKSAY